MIWKVNKNFKTIVSEANDSQLAHPNSWGHIQILQDYSTKFEKLLEAGEVMPK